MGEAGIFAADDRVESSGHRKLLMTALSVNLNKIAWLRNAREGSRPSVLDAARTIIAAGAQGITVHPRPDQRHIRPDDVHALAQMLASDYPHIEYNIEGNPAAGPRDNGYPGFDHLIESARPHQATLVPDGDAQLTSDHGWDLSDPDEAARVAETIARYQGWGARVSLFMDPVEEQIARAKECGADRIELYTGPYADLVEHHGLDHPDARACRQTYLDATRCATEARPRRQCRARPEPRQPRGVHRHRRYRRGLHRPCPDCRCAGIRPLRIGAQVSRRHRRRESVKSSD